MDLDAVLAACNSNDNTIRKQAEQTITSAAKSPEILSQLMQRLQSAEQPQVSSESLPGADVCAKPFICTCLHALATALFSAEASLLIAFVHMQSYKMRDVLNSMCRV